MISQGWKLFAATLLCLTLLFGTPLVFSQENSETQPAVQPVTPPQPETVKGVAEPADDSKTPAPADAAAAQTQDIQIGAGDLIEIRVFGVQDLAQETRVSGTGDISVPLVGPVHVAGLTQSEAEALIANKLRDGGFIKDPHVSVFTKEYATQGISVLGEVSRPGVYPLLGPRKLFDVISMAGGLTTRAGKQITITHRDDPGDPLKIQLTGDPAKTAGTNPPVTPGDTIFVAKAGVVYVVGDVAHPAGFIMDNNERLTVLQAIALAGGTNKTASLRSARIIRKGPSGIQEIPMPLNKILSADAEDVPLQPEDVLFVPLSRAKNAAQRSAEAILQVATGLAIYHH